jgi:hypothetical protein
MAIGVLMVLVAGLTEAPQTTWWHEAILIPPFEYGALNALKLLPKDLAQHFSFDQEV